MLNMKIDYKSIIMRCNKVNRSAFCELSGDLEIQYYEHGMEEIWIDIQKSVGSFESYSDAYIMGLF